MTRSYTTGFGFAYCFILCVYIISGKYILCHNIRLVTLFHKSHNFTFLRVKNTSFTTKIV